MLKYGNSVRGKTMDTHVKTGSAKQLAASAQDAASYLKSLSHGGRLMILCHLVSGEKSVGTLESLLDVRQAAVSQMLARLRDDELVKTRREGKTIFYSLADAKTIELITLLHQHFCETN